VSLSSVRSIAAYALRRGIRQSENEKLKTLIDRNAMVKVSVNQLINQSINQSINVLASCAKAVQLLLLLLLLLLLWKSYTRYSS